MQLARILVSIAAVAAAVVPAHARATVYRWVDANGVVNYSNQRPPEQKNATRLDEASSRVSTIPGPSAEELARQRTFLLEARVDRLERELRDQRYAADALVMIGQPSPPLMVGASPWFGWWGAPVAVNRGWHMRRFPNAGWPPHAGWPVHAVPLPAPRAASAPMRFQNARTAPGGRGGHR